MPTAVRPGRAPYRTGMARVWHDWRGGACAGCGLAASFAGPYRYGGGLREVLRWRSPAGVLVCQQPRTAAATAGRPPIGGRAELAALLAEAPAAMPGCPRRPWPG
jgi:hypothetical protein